MVSEDRPNPHEGGKKKNLLPFCYIIIFFFLRLCKMRSAQAIEAYIARSFSSKMAARMEEKTNGLSVDEIHARGRLFSRASSLVSQEVIDLKGEREEKKGAHPYLLYSLYAMPPPQRHMARARKNIRGAPSYIDEDR